MNDNSSLLVTAELILILSLCYSLYKLANAISCWLQTKLKFSIPPWATKPGNSITVMIVTTSLVLAILAWQVPRDNWLGELRGEITGIAITVSIIDILTGYRLYIQRKQEIFEQLRSPVRDVAVEAMRIVVNNDTWLEEVKKSVDLTLAQLEKVYLPDADLTGIKLQGANLKEAILHDADLTEASLFGANLKKADLLRAYMEDADLFEAELQGAVLMNAKLQRADLRRANLMGADLRGAQLQGAKLCKAILRGADLREAKLQNADLSGADLQYCKYSKRTTKWPDGFDPINAGAISDVD